MSDGKELSLLRLVNITKEFPGVCALNDVNFELKSGEVHVLFGENGAGKSTLISIVAGATKPTAGEVWIRGESVHLNSVHEAREFGISAVFQEFSLVPQMTVEENLFLGSEIVQAGILQKRAIRKRVKGSARRFRVSTSNRQKGGPADQSRTADGRNCQGISLGAADTDS